MQNERERFERYRDTNNESVAEVKPGYLNRSLKLFLKQCIAVVLIIGLGIFVYRINFEFGEKCISALGRAVRYNFDWAGIWSGICGYFGNIWGIISEIF